jgi:hypothetical protein
VAEDWELADGLINRLKAVEDEDLRAIEGDGEATELPKYLVVNWRSRD